MESQLLTPKEAAKILSVDRVTIYKWIKSDLLKAYKIEGVVRIKKEDLDNFIERRQKK